MIAGWMATASATQFGEAAREPGEEGWYGPAWVRADAQDQLEPAVEVTSFPGDVDQWVQVTVLGLGVEYGWSMGPFEAQAVPFTVPIDLPVEGNGSGLVQVYVLLEVTDVDTGDNRAHVRTEAAYVAGAGTASEVWFDEEAATSRVRVNLPVALAEGEELDGHLVGAVVIP